MKKLNSLVIGLVVLGLVLVSFACAAPKPAPTTPAEVSFAGKIITIVNSSTPGSGSDVVARVYSRYLSRFLPGNPTIIVRNMPGANATIGSNYVYSSKPDGLTLLAPTGAAFLGDLFNMKAAQYEFVKMPAVIAFPMGTVFYCRPGIVDKPEDLPKAKGIIFGYSGGTSGWLFVVAKEVLNIPTEKVVLAYAGSGDALRAFLSGETNMSVGSTATTAETLAPEVEKGRVMLVFQSGIFDEKGNLVREPAAPGILTLNELYEKIQGKSLSGIAWESYKALLAGNMYDKPLFLAPGTPGSIVRVYWDAADKMVKDAEFGKTIAPLVGKDPQWKTGEAFDKEFKLTFGMKPEVVEWLKGTMKKYGVFIE